MLTLLRADVEINSSWQRIRENVKILAIESLDYYELKKHKTWFDEGCSKLSIKGNKLNCSGYSIQMK
jgi:hypothetical protein